MDKSATTWISRLTGIERLFIQIPRNSIADEAKAWSTLGLASPTYKPLEDFNADSMKSDIRAHRALFYLIGSPTPET